MNIILAQGVELTRVFVELSIGGCVHNYYIVDNKISQYLKIFLKE